MEEVRSLLAIIGLDVDEAQAREAGDAVTAPFRQLQGLIAAAAAALSAGLFGAMIRESVQFGDELGDTADRLGITAQQLQFLRFAAEEAGIEVGSLEQGFVILQRTIGQAIAGPTGEQAAAFREMGISLQDAAGHIRPTQEVFNDAADRIAALGSDAERSAAAQRLFGRGGVALLPILRRGSQRIDEMRTAFRELGIEVTDEFIESTGNADAQLRRMDLTWTALKNSIVSEVLPAFISTVAWVRNLVSQFTAMTRNSNLLKAGLIVLGAAAVATGVAAFLAWLPASLTFLAIGASLVFAALALDDFLTFMRGGRSLIGAFLDSSFGPQAQGQVRAFFTQVGALFSQIVTMIRGPAFRFLAQYLAILIAMAVAIGLAFAFSLAGIVIGIAAVISALQSFAQWVTNIRTSIADAFVAARDAAFGTFFSPVFGWIEQARGMLARAFGPFAGALGLTGTIDQFTSGAQNNAAIGAANAANQRALAVSQAITVNVTGTSTPQETAAAVSNAVRRSSDDNLRKTRRALTPEG